MTIRFSLNRSIHLILAASAFCAAGPAAYAEATAGQATLEEVVITGSRIGRPELESTTPITIVSAALIESTGSLNTADVLRNLPAVGISGLSGSNSNFLTSSSGVNTINLRNLGDSRTLVLINGRRMVPGVAGDSAADFNMIPTDFIERIDVITGGASAVYGSEAVAGVVNVVLKEHFNGVRIRGQGGGSSGGGANTKLGSLTVGSDFADGRGNAFFNVSYDKDSGLYSRQRAISTTDTSTSFPGIFGAFSSYNPAGGVYLADSTFTPIDGRFTLKPNGTWNYARTSDGFNRDAYRRITIPIDRTLVSANINYDLADKQKLYTEFTYGQTHTQSDIEPFALGVGPVGGIGVPSSPITDNVYFGQGGVPLNNPFIPQDILNVIAADNEGLVCTGATPDPNCVTSLGVRKRLTGVAIRSSDARRQTSRIVTGLKGDLFSTAWNYDVYYSYGRTTDNQTSTGQVNVLNIRNALDVITLNGQYACADPVARAQGCVPLNLFGPNSITPDAAAYINAPSSRDVTIQQQVISAFATGPLFKLPAGEVRAVVGAEHRKEDSSEQLDALTIAGLNGGNKLSNTFGSYTVKEVFGEISVPLVAGAPGIKDMGLEAAVRNSDYSTVGRVTTWNLRLNYAPIDDIRIRGAYSHAVRAPNIGELFSGAAQTYPGNNFNDPCDGINAASTGAVATACKAIPAVAAAITADPVNGFQYSYLDYQTITGYNSGNPHLNPETAKTYTLGLVLTPTALRNFNATIDYFNIKIADAVGGPDYTTQLTTCLLAPTTCGGIFRDSVTGKLTRVDQQLINVNDISTAGVDLAARYRVDLSSKIGGAIDIGLNYTHTSKFDITSPGSPTQMFVGQIDYPKNKGSLQLDYAGHGFEFGWTIRYQSSMKDQVNPDYVSPSQAPFNNVPAYTYHDLQLKYSWDASKLKSSIYGGVRNVFDKKPPFLPSGMTNQTTGVETAADQYDAIGRQFFLGVEVSL